MSWPADLRLVLIAFLIAAVSPAQAGFTDNGDGTVTDTITGLMWDKCSWGQSGATCATGSATTHAWAQALGVAVTANGSSHRGYADWRLPNRNELMSLLKIDTWNPAIDSTVFPNTVAGESWTSTTDAISPGRAWVVDFRLGTVYTNDKTNTNRVRLVRSGQSFASFDSLGDVTAPTLSSVGVSATSSTGTTLSATSNEAATGYWVVLAGNGATAPSAAQVKAGQTHTGAAGVTSGNAAMTAATAKDFSVTGLTASTAYTVCVMAEDASANQSTVTCTDLTTSAAAVNGACGAANGVARTSAPSAGLCATGSASAVTSGAASYTWSCTGSGGGSTASCSAPRAYTVTPAAGANGSLAPATPQTVTYGATQAFTVTPGAGYQLAAISGCGGSLAGSTYTTAVATGDCTVTASFSAVVVTPPEPPPPPPPPTLPSGGGDLSVAAGSTVVVSDNSRTGSTLTLTGSGRTQINIGNGTLTVDTTGTARFTVVRASDGSLALRVDDASFTVGGGNQPLLVAGGLALTGQGGNNSLRVLYVGGKLKKIAVLAGSILLPGNSFAAASGQLHAGEVAEFDANERVTTRYLGSFDGTAGQIGDRLPTFSNALAIPSGVPILTALPERQRTGGQSLTLDRQLTQVLLPYGLGALGQDTQGVIRLVGNDTSLYAAQPLGRVQVADGEANGLSFNADGSARAVVNGYAFLLVPAVADPSGLANAMAAQRPGTSASLGAEGEWRFTERNGNTTVVRPGWGLSPATGGAGLGTDASGNLFYGHDSLFGSVLYPALADRARILAAARQLDPAATLTSVVGGETVLVLSGQRYVLSPESVLVDVPAAHANDPFWVAGGKLFVPAGEGKAQGFGLR